jgi:hypothetical protein
LVDVTSVKTSIFLIPTGHHRPNETLPCPYNAVCWIHMEEYKSLIPVCYVPVADGCGWLRKLC